MAHLPNDVARCSGITDHSNKQPVPLCATCARWQAIGTPHQGAKQIGPAAQIVRDGFKLYLACELRISAG